MSQKILYFLAGPAPTSAELAEIATINAIAAAPYEVQVLNGKPKAEIVSINVSAAQADNSYNDAGATITAGTISAAAADNSLNDSGNGFVTAGFKAGDPITISGFTGETDNNDTARIVSVAAGKMVISGLTLKNDDEGEAVTVSTGGRFLDRGFAAGDTVLVRGFTGNAANNITSGVISSVTATKMIIAGAAGDAIVNDSAGESVTISVIDTTAKYGYGAIAADYVAGTVPQAYRNSSGVPLYTVLDPANPPDVPALIDTQTVLSDAETIELDTAGTVTVTVADGDISAADVAATESVVTDGDTLALTTAGTVTLAVADHVLSGDVAATEAVVANGDTVALGSDDITLAVAAHVITPSIGATKSIVENGDTVTVDGAAVTLAVAGGAVTGGSLAATKCVVTDADTVSVHGQTCTLTVAANALVSGALPATAAVVTNTMEISITGGAGTTKVTLTVAGNVITGCVLS